MDMSPRSTKNAHQAIADLSARFAALMAQFQADKGHRCKRIERLEAENLARFAILEERVTALERALASRDTLLTALVVQLAMRAGRQTNPPTTDHMTTHRHSQ